MKVAEAKKRELVARQAALKRADQLREVDFTAMEQQLREHSTIGAGFSLGIPCKPGKPGKPGAGIRSRALAG
jgi:hypothetical protein